MTSQLLFPAMRNTIAFLSVFTLAACSTNEILDVENPDQITADAANNAAGADALRAAVVGYFGDSYTGSSQPGVIMLAGAMSDELAASSPLDVPSIDSRNADPRVSFVQQQMRYQTRVITGAALAVEALQKYSPTPASKIGHVYALRAMMETIMGEEYCNGVPISGIVDGKIVYGKPLTNTEMFQLAVAHFDTAMRFLSGPDSARVLNLSRIGKGRALVNLRQYAAAAAAVAGTADGFVYQSEHSASSSIQNNGVFVWMTGAKWFTVADREGGVGLPYRSDNDPRVVAVRNGVGIDQTTPFYAYGKYPAVASPATVADGIEARLIEAEAQLQTAPEQWLATLNALRTRVSLLAPLSDPGTQDARVSLHFKERAYWLFGTGHRLGDMRRLVRQYGRAAASVYPSGPYPLGGTYGTDLNFPVPYDEVNNPSAQGCVDRNA